MDTITLKDGNLASRNFFAVKDANDIYSLLATSKSFLLAVQMGQIPEMSLVDKFGLNPSITTGPEDIWEGGGVYTYDSNADVVSLASSNAADNQVINVQGLDGTGVFVSQDITLNGTTRVALTTPLWRVFRMQNQGSTDIAGNVFCYTGTGTVPSIGDPEVRAIITNGSNQTLMALYTIPSGKVGFMLGGEVGINLSGSVFAGTQFARPDFKSRTDGGVFKTKKSVTLISQASSNYIDKRVVPMVAPALTDVKLTIQEVSTTMGCIGTFQILLVDESLFSTAYLQSIGQPGA